MSAYHTDMTLLSCAFSEIPRPTITQGAYEQLDNPAVTTKPLKIFVGLSQCNTIQTIRHVLPLDPTVLFNKRRVDIH